MRWSPQSFEQARDDVANRVIRETQFLEFKQLIDLGGDKGKGKLYKALASLANLGGTLVLGVVEDKAAEKATEIKPVPLQGQVERVVQLAGNLDPPLPLPTPRSLDNPEDPTTGVIVVDVPASPMAPHRTPDNGYFARSPKGAYPMPDADLERMIRLRRERTVAVEDALAEHVDSVTPLLELNEYPQPWFAIAVDPVPSLAPFLLRNRLDHTAAKWLETHMTQARENVAERAKADPKLGTVIEGWSPYYAWEAPIRIDGGVRLITRERSSNRAPREPARAKFGVIEIHETGGIRVSEKSTFHNMRYDQEGNAGTAVVEWQRILGAAAWTIALFHSIHKEAGLWAGANVAVRVGGLSDTMASEGVLQALGERRWEGLNPYPADAYKQSRGLNGPDVTGDLQPALDWLFGQMVRNYGLPDLLHEPKS